eukprot:6884771-Alexandrium_andersonii.AAC.1
MCIRDSVARPAGARDVLDRTGGMRLHTAGRPLLAGQRSVARVATQDRDARRLPAARARRTGLWPRRRCRRVARTGEVGRRHRPGGPESATLGARGAPQTLLAGLRLDDCRAARGQSQGLSHET